MRGPSGGGSESKGSNGGGHAVPRGSHDGGSSGSTNTGDRAAFRGDPHAKTPDSVPAYSRPREGRPSVGEAVPRTGLPPSLGNPFGGGYFGGYYPWGFGGIGLGGYYGGFYDPYDPWFGGYGGYGGYGEYGGGSSQYSSRYGEEGSLHLKVKPHDASVYVDGYYVGIVDEFDGIFQRLHIEAGPHRIEIRAPGYETMTLDVHVEPDHTTTYKGELKKIQ